MNALEQVLALAQTKWQEALGENLISLSLTGSAAAGDFVPAASDVNLLLVVRRLDLPVLDQIRRVLTSLAKYRVSAPLVLTAEDLARSRDAFPIEFLELQEKRRVLFGPDPLAKLKLSLKNLRLECEHELKGRLIRLRESYLELGDHPRRLQPLLLAAQAANFPAFRAALRLKRIKPPTAKDAVLVQLCQHFGLERRPFMQLSALRRGDQRLDRNGLRRLFTDYLQEVEKLVRALDHL